MKRSKNYFISILIITTVSLPIFLISYFFNNSSADNSFDQIDEIEYTGDELLGKINPAQNPDFIVVESIYTKRAGVYLRREAYKAYIDMYHAALSDGIDLIVLSATRTFYDQKYIWESKWTGARLANGGQDLSVVFPDPIDRAKAILRWSSMPGTSRHHWGTDVDLNSLENSYFLEGVGKEIYRWLTKNAGKFGFYQVYTPIGGNYSRQTGYQEEKWHWSYLPIARVMFRQYIDKIGDEDIAGFKGSETAASIEVIKNYVTGINPECR